MPTLTENLLAKRANSPAVHPAQDHPTRRKPNKIPPDATAPKKHERHRHPRIGSHRVPRFMVVRDLLHGPRDPLLRLGVRFDE